MCGSGGGSTNEKLDGRSGVGRSCSDEVADSSRNKSRLAILHLILHNFCTKSLAMLSFLTKSSEKFLRKR